ncbi:MAG: hypothetical protein GXY83_07815 [Rhodopirellula sp.]|nr:hypothetical protein [Rhodopirellula sp.]
MRRVITELFVLFGAYTAVAAGCLLLGLLATMALESAVDRRIQAGVRSESCCDRIVIMDWEAGVTRYARTKEGAGCAPAVAEQAPPGILNAVEIDYEQKFQPDHYSMYLRDAVTGRLQRAYGVWYWTVNDGVENGFVDGKQFINARLPDTRQ